MFGAYAKRLGGFVLLIGISQFNAGGAMAQYECGMMPYSSPDACFQSGQSATTAGAVSDSISRSVTDQQNQVLNAKVRGTVEVEPGLFPTSRLRAGFHDGYQSLDPAAHDNGSSFRTDEISAFGSGFVELPGAFLGGQLQAGAFAGYAQIQLKSGPIHGIPGTDYGNKSDNGSFVGGGYALYTGGANYGMLTLSGNVGESEQISQDIGTAFSAFYGTSGFVGSFIGGHVFDLIHGETFKDRGAAGGLKLDLRGGLGYQTFEGARFVDPAGQSLKAEAEAWIGMASATVFTTTQWGEGTLRPYVKGEVRQQLSYDNTVHYYGPDAPRTFGFGQNDTMGVIELGFDYALKGATFTAAIYGDLAGDQEGVGARLALKFKLNDTAQLK
jgi:hypothetical protein